MIHYAPQSAASGMQMVENASWGTEEKKNHHNQRKPNAIYKKHW